MKKKIVKILSAYLYEMKNKYLKDFTCDTHFGYASILCSSAFLFGLIGKPLNEVLLHVCKKRNG